MWVHVLLETALVVFAVSVTLALLAIVFGLGWELWQWFRNGFR